MTNEKPDRPKVRVLYLDDEENNLRSFKATFRRDYDVYTAVTSEEAFKIIKAVNPQVIFSDQRMPVTTGVEFFNAVRQVYPDPVRILITGYTDINDIIEAINRGHIYRYITKPWSEHEIRVSIENALEIYNTRKALEEKVSELEKTNHELNRFIYSASHDLRSPVTSLMGLLRVAEFEVKDPVALDFFSKVDQTVHRLEHLISNTVDYYKNSRAEVQSDEIEINTLINYVVESIQSTSGSIDANIKTSIQGDGVFLGDEFRLRIVLSHLISNAIKFRKPEQEKAEVEITFSYDEDFGTLRVKDDGIGVLEEHVHQIFDMFFKTKESREGAGLGLFVVKEALDKMDGKISLNSEIGKGTVFTITLPNQLNN